MNIDASVILITGDGPDSLVGNLSCLRQQTIANRLEVIIMTREEHVDATKQLRPNEFAEFEVYAGDLSTSARARVGAVHKARAPVVIFTEDHAFPRQSAWAERILAAFEADASVAVVGPSMINANPRAGASWATMFIEYGPWISIQKPGFTEALPGHNSAYRKDILLSYGDALADMMEAEWVMHKDLLTKGEKLWVDPEIQVAHLNYSIFSKSIALHHLGGRMFASARCADWSLGKRLAYALAAPLILAKRFVAIAHLGVTHKLRSEFFRSIPQLIIFLIVGGAGETAGFLFGTGSRESDFAELEYARWRNVTPEEAKLLSQPAS